MSAASFHVSKDGPEFLMEFVDGVDLTSHVRQAGKDTLTELVPEILSTLAYLHDRDLIHRDLKPANILVRKLPIDEQRVVLVDLGMALARRDPVERSRPAGTLAYLAPELFDGASASVRTDLYSVGVAVAECLIGDPPFRFDGDLGAFLEEVRQGLRLDGAVGPPGLAQWAKELASPAATDRPADALEALHRFESLTGAKGPEFRRGLVRGALRSGPPPGRLKEWGAVLSWLNDTVDVPAMTFITGSSGSGKSDFLERLYPECVGRDWRSIRAADLEAGLYSWRSIPEEGSAKSSLWMTPRN